MDQKQRQSIEPREPAVAGGDDAGTSRREAQRRQALVGAFDARLAEVRALIHQSESKANVRAEDVRTAIGGQ